MLETIAYIDGASRGHPGPSGIGIVFHHPAGGRLEISRPIPAADNNYAEYAALLAALAYAVEHQFRRLRVYSDSEVVVRQMNGHYSCRSPLLRRSYELCTALIASLDDFSIRHIRRELNQDADRLARAAIAPGPRPRRGRRRTTSRPPLLLASP